MIYKIIKRNLASFLFLCEQVFKMIFQDFYENKIKMMKILLYIWKLNENISGPLSQKTLAI